MNSKAKGNAGEREFAAYLLENGISTAKREIQYYGGGIAWPDVSGLPGCHVEVKRVEKLNLDAAMAQSIKDADGKAAPIVAFRKNRKPWMIVMLADDWLDLYKKPSGSGFNKA